MIHTVMTALIASRDNCGHLIPNERQASSALIYVNASAYAGPGAKTCERRENRNAAGILVGG